MKDFLAKYMPPDYSAHGAQLDDLSAIVHWMMLILFVGWGLLFVYMLFRFRASRNPRAAYKGAQTHLSTYAEAGIAVVEIILLVVFSIPLWRKWTTAPPPSSKPLQIRVVAEQFAWNAHYPGADGIFGRTDVKLVSPSNPLGIDPKDPHAADDVATLNDIRFEVNRPALVRISSKDVIHSFSLPYMRVKQDATPGIDVNVHFTPVVVTPPKATWEIACAQLCGLGHYRMKGQYKVHDKQQFEAWMAQAPTVGATLQ